MPILNYPGKRPIKTEIDRGASQELGQGLSEGTVRSVIGEITRNNVSRGLSLAEKTFDHSEMNSKERRTLIEKIIKTHLKLKKNGLPTIPTMRTESEGESIFMTDLTKSGKNEVVSLPDWAKGKERKGKFSETEYKIEISNIGDIENELADMLLKLIESGCKLNLSDVFFIVVDRASKKGKIILGDLAEIEFVSLETAAEKEDLRKSNYEVILAFFRAMREHIETDRKFSIDPILQEAKRLREIFKAV